MANAIFVWGLAAPGGRVLLRIEDHDRVRSRPEFEADLLEDLAWLGFVADEGPMRQSDDETRMPPRSSDSARRVSSTAATAHGRRSRRGRATTAASGTARAVRAGAAPVAWTGRCCGSPWAAARNGGWTASSGRARTRCADGGDLPVRDRDGNWTYGFSVVVDDLRQGVDLVIRGRDLLGATAAQIRLGRLLGRETPAAFAHHPLVRATDGRKLSKADGATSVRDLRAAGPRRLS